MSELCQEIVDAAAELLAAIERKYEHETARKRSNALSPRIEDAIEVLAKLIAERAKNNDR
jgi:hypothetical protein